jgi:cysteine desulfurase / selenocysteine lyase
MTRSAAGERGTNRADTDGWLARVRGDFPYRPGRVYLQSAGVGLPIPGAAAAAGQYYLEVASLGCDAQPAWHRPATSAKQRMARLLEVPVEDVGFFRNTSEIVNLVASSVKWCPGDEVVVLADEYPCNVLPWLQAEAAGATVVRVDPGGVHERQQHLLDALSDRTRIMSVSHVHPWTGTRLDLTPLGRACREVGALLVVDGIQALGATRVDLSHVDVYGAGVFKWLLSGFGTAIGVFRERARSMLAPAFRSYGNPPPSRSFEYAAPNIPGLYVLDATLGYLEELGWDRILERVDGLTSYVLEALERVGIAAITPREAHAGIVSVGVHDSTAVVEGLKRRGVDVSDKMGRVIVSPHFYNTDDDVDRFADALDAVLRAQECGRQKQPAR